MGIEEETESLLTRAANPDTATDELAKIFQMHLKCWTMDSEYDPCDLCEQLEEEGEDLVLVLAENPAITAKQQELLYDCAMSVQGYDVALALMFATNTNLSQSSKSFVLETDWVAILGAEAADYLSALAKSIKQNPGFTKEDLDLLIENHAEYDAIDGWWK